MRREWTSNWNEMGFNEEELAMVEKVFNCDPASTLYFDGDKNYLWETECGDDYFNKELLIENLALTLTEWEKEGMFDEEDEEESEAPADPWLKVLEDRVALETEKELLHRQAIPDTINKFKEWVNTAAEIDIYGDVEYKAKTITDAKYTYKAVWKRLCDAKAELEQYKKTMKL